MSVIQRIRDKGAWFVFGIIALALLAFILQDGSFRRGNFFSNGFFLEENRRKILLLIDQE